METTNTNQDKQQPLMFFYDFCKCCVHIPESMTALTILVEGLRISINREGAAKKLCLGRVAY